MTTDRDLERRLSESFRAQPAPGNAHEVHSAAMARAARSRQRPVWLVAAHGGSMGGAWMSTPRTTAWVLLAAALLAIALGSAIVVGAINLDRQAHRPIPRPGPIPGAANAFAAPFDYTLVDDDVRRVEARDDRLTVAFVMGTTVAAPDTDNTYGGRHQAIGSNVRGIAIVAVSEAATHPCPMGGDRPARPPLGDTPELLVAGLRTTAGAALAARPQEWVDGHRALVVDVLPNEHSCDVTDIHTNTGDYFSLEVPSRLYVLEVGSELVLIDVWARSNEDLADWMPLAMQLVRSIRFR